MTRTSLCWEKWGEKNNKLTYPSLDILKDLLPLEENTGSTNKLHWSLENCSSFVKAQRTQALRGPTNSGKMPNPKQAISQRPISSALILKNQRIIRKNWRAGKITDGLNCVRLASVGRRLSKWQVPIGDRNRYWQTLRKSKFTP